MTYATSRRYKPNLPDAQATFGHTRAVLAAWRFVWLSCVALAVPLPAWAIPAPPNQTGRPPVVEEAGKNKRSLRKRRNKRRLRHLDLRPTLRWVAQGQPPQKQPSTPTVRPGTNGTPTRSAGAINGNLEIKLPPSRELTLPQRDLTFVFRQAKRRNIDLKILKQQLVLAEIARSQAWVPFRPRVNAAGSYTRNQFETVIATGQGPPRVITPKDQFTLNVQMQWQFLNFQAIPQIQIAHLLKKQTGKNVDQLRRDPYFSVAQTYYSVLLAEGTLRISRRSWANAMEHLTIADNRLKAGMTTSLAKMQAQLDVARAKQTWFNARNELRNTKLTLALLLGLPSFPYRAKKPAPRQTPRGKLQNWLNRATLQREELQARKLAMQIAMKQRQEAWLAYLPTAALTGGVNVSNAGGFVGQNAQWNVGVTVQWALYNGGIRSLALRQAHAQVLRTTLEYQRTKQEIDNEVKKAYLDLQNADLAVNIARRSAQLARSTYELRQQQYRVGVGTSLDVSDANTQLLSAEISFLRERLNRELVILRLQRAVGAFLPK